MLRSAVLNLQNEVISEPYFEGFSSLSRTALAFHAKDDLPEIRYLFFKMLTTLDFSAKFVVARKIERVFRNNFGGKEEHFYDHLVSQLFRDALDVRQHSYVYFAQRGSHSRQQPLVKAIERGVAEAGANQGQENRVSFSIFAQKPRGEPCLSIVDYMNWAVYRAYTRGEMRFFRSVRDKVSLLVDLYDTDKHPRNWYGKENPFEIAKVTPL